MEIQYSLILSEVRQFDGTNCIEILGWMGLDYTNPELHTTDHPVIHSDAGEFICKPGDFIGRGRNGEFYILPYDQTRFLGESWNTPKII